MADAARGTIQPHFAGQMQHEEHFNLFLQAGAAREALQQFSMHAEHPAYFLSPGRWSEALLCPVLLSSSSPYSCRLGGVTLPSNQ